MVQAEALDAMGARLTTALSPADVAEQHEAYMQSAASIARRPLLNQALRLGNDRAAWEAVRADTCGADGLVDVPTATWHRWLLQAIAHHRLSDVVMLVGVGADLDVLDMHGRSGRQMMVRQLKHALSRNDARVFRSWAETSCRATGVALGRGRSLAYRLEDDQAIRRAWLREMDAMAAEVARTPLDMSVTHAESQALSVYDFANTLDYSLYTWAAAQAVAASEGIDALDTDNADLLRIQSRALTVETALGIEDIRTKFITTYQWAASLAALNNTVPRRSLL